MRKTLALVYGINEYYQNARLTNAVGDATAIKDVFERLGYDVIFKTDCSNQELFDGLSEFKDRIEGYDAAIFYFAGHGFQFRGENYLASKECQVATPEPYHCRMTCMLLSDVMNVFSTVPDHANLAIIDACRVSFDRGASSFKPVHAPKGTMIAFSTSPGDGAWDGGMEGHSVYTGALLEFIGRERLSVEELFKKVRKVVYTITGGARTTWEHTSLTGDFYFNTGQLALSVSIPYDEKAVKDRQFIETGTPVNGIIRDLKALNWNVQNPAMERLAMIDPSGIDKNDQFLLGRNIFQASFAAFGAKNFMDNLRENLRRFTQDRQNHVLNGILFEIYFDNNGDFRYGNLKRNYLQEIFDLRKDNSFNSAFAFIHETLAPYIEELFYLPGSSENILDITVVASVKNEVEPDGSTVTFECISQISVNGKDVVKRIARNYFLWGQNEEALKSVLAEELVVPVELLKITTNKTLNTIVFPVGLF